MGISSGAEKKEGRAKTAHMITMHDASAPQDQKLVAYGDDDSEFEELFDEDMEVGWTGVSAHPREVPKDDHVKKFYEPKKLNRVNDIKDKVQSEVIKAAPIVAEAAGVLARAGASILAEGISYVCREAAETIVNNMPSLEDVKSTVLERRDSMIDRNRPRLMADRLASKWSLPPNSRITDPRDAPEGTNLDDLALMATLDKAAVLRQKKRDAGEMEDVPLKYESGSEWEDDV